MIVPAEVHDDEIRLERQTVRLGGDASLVTGPLVTEMAQEGDAFCREHITTLGTWLGEGIASLAAVLEDVRGGLSYWACSHPSARPDFHDRRGWPLVVYPKQHT